MIDFTYRRATTADDAVASAAGLRQQAQFIGGSSPELLQPDQPIYLLHHRSITRDSVVIGEGNNIESALISFAKDIDITCGGIEIIPRRRGMQV